MKKVIMLAAVMIMIAFGATFAYAQDSGSNTTGSSDSGSNKSVQTLDNPLPNVKSVGDLVKTGLEIFTYVAVIIGVIMLILVGFQYIMARGSPDKMKEASQRLLYIIIGIAIVIGARIAVSIVISTLDVSGAVDPKVIQSAKNALK